jgi:hypothetical protein
MAPPANESEQGTGGYGSNMKIVAAGILVMGISLVIVIGLYLWFGHIGPTFSAKRMLDQQTELRQQYGLPPTPPVPNNQLEVPPSERNLTQSSSGGSTTATP